MLIRCLLLLNLFFINSCNVASVLTGAETDLGDNFELDVTEGLLVFWRFNEGQNQNKVDSQNGVVLNDTSSTGFIMQSGISGGAPDCSSNSSGSGFFETGSFPYGIDASNSNYNISFWMQHYVSASATVTTIMENPGNNISFTQLIAPDRLDMQFTIGSGSMTISGLIDANDFNNWVHLSFNIFASGNMDVYKNGNFFGSYALNATSSSSTTFILCSGTGGTSGLNGLIDSFGIWERDLDSKEIKALYSGNNNVD